MVHAQRLLPVAQTRGIVIATDSKYEMQVSDYGKASGNSLVYKYSPMDEGRSLTAQLPLIVSNGIPARAIALH